VEYTPYENKFLQQRKQVPANKLQVREVEAKPEDNARRLYKVTSRWTFSALKGLDQYRLKVKKMI